MSFWEKIQSDLKKNIQEGMEIFREGSSAVTQRLEKLTDEGKKKYQVFNLNMKVQDEFARLGGAIYDLVKKKSKNPLGNRTVTSIIRKINKLEDEISKLEGKAPKSALKKKTSKKKTSKKKTAASRKTATGRKTAATKKPETVSTEAAAE
jgi:hypothetical protein